jgi:hypothetical protein
MPTRLFDSVLFSCAELIDQKPSKRANIMNLDHIETGEVENLSASLRGPLIYPSDDNYDEARRVYNAMHDRRPSLIVQATDIADVIATVNFAREQGLDLAIRGGGHSVPGFGTCDDGIVLDLGW